MSDFTTTPNLGLYKPTYDADAEQWGAHLNSNADALDAAFSPTGGHFVPLSGGTMTGMLTLAATPVNPLDAAPKSYVDGAVTRAGGPFLPLSGGTMTGALTVPRLNISNIPSAKPDGSPPVGAVKGDLYINGGFVCIAP